MKNKQKKTDRSDKFTYKSGDLKIIKAKKIKESYSSFAEFLSEKEEKFVASTMRWITIKDEQDRNQHILIKKKDGTILGGMGGTHNGEKLKDVFKDLEDERKEIEKKEAKPYAKTKYDEIDPPSRERFAREMRAAKLIEEFRDGSRLSKDEIHSEEFRLSTEHISNAEEEAIEAYTGAQYFNMNGILRNYNKWKKEMVSRLEDEAFEEYELEDEKDIRQFVNNQLREVEHEAELYTKYLRNALNKAKTKKNMITYRGISSSYINEIMDNLKIGDSIVDAGFISSSTDKNVARGFANENGYIMEILIPAGSHATSVDHISTNNGEEEVLIENNSTFEICEVNHEQKKLVVFLRNDKKKYY